MGREKAWCTASLGIAALAAALAAACAEDPNNLLGHRSGRGGDDGVQAGSSAPPITPSNPDTKAVAARVRRLNELEIKNSLRDIFGITDFGTVTFPRETPHDEFDDVNDMLGYGDDFLAAITSVGEATGALVAKDPSRFVVCNPQSDGEATCVGKFVDQYGYLAFRRTPSAVERARLLALFDKTRTTEDYATSLATVVEALVESPNFVYRTELGDASNKAAPLTRWELATALSFFLLRTTPDVRLLDAAKSGALDTRDGIVSEARRLMTDPRAKDAVRSFFLQWLEMTGTTKITKSDAAFDGDLARSMVAETTRFVDEVVWNSTTGFAAMLTSPNTFVDAKLAPIYGVPAPAGKELVATALDPTRRAGLLTQSGFIATHTPGENRSPIFLGRFIRRKMFCQTPPPPPPGIPPVPADATLDVHARYAKHATDPSCAGCHNLMDPLGFGFSQYDVMGRFDPVDHGVTEDGAGELKATDVDGVFHGPVELGQKLLQSKMARRCFSGTMFSFALGRTLNDSGAVPIDRAAVDGAVNGNFGSGDLKELLVSVISADAFLFRDTTALLDGGP